MNDDNRPTNHGVQAAKRWVAAVKRLELMKAELNRAQCEASNAESALAAWLLPPDAVVGEKVSMWFGDTLLQAQAKECIGTKQWAGPVTVRIKGPQFEDTFR